MYNEGELQCFQLLTLDLRLVPRLFDTDVQDRENIAALAAMDHGHPRRLCGYKHSRLASSDRQTLKQRVFILHRGGQAVGADRLQRSKTV